MPARAPARPAPTGSTGATGPPGGPTGAAARGSGGSRTADEVARWLRLLTRGRDGRVTHVRHLPARPGRPVAWPEWVAPGVVTRAAAAGVLRPWAHQVQAAELAHAGHSVVLATGTASGKSVAYLLPALSDALELGSTTLYLAPTKALAADQLRAVRALAPEQVAVATFDGDTDAEERAWARTRADLVLSNPDMLHRGLLPGHARWARFLGSLRYVVVDECHSYRGVFGSHVAQVLRRLRRLAAFYGADPVLVLASATVSDPRGSAERLVGLPVTEVTEDGSPHGPAAFVLWEPPASGLAGERGAPLRRSAAAETADLLADLVAAGVRTLAFVRSRRAAEAVALAARRRLVERQPTAADRVAAYRGGYLPEERRALERSVRRGQLLGLASTSALELGVDLVGLDAVLLAGYPGTVAAVWQRTGRAGRAGRPALGVFVARDDPLDSYLVHHPEALIDRPMEATVLDPDNPHVLGPQLAAAAADLPLTDEDAVRWFGRQAVGLLTDAAGRGWVRRRPGGWYWVRRERAADLVDLRGSGDPPVRIVEQGTGRLLGTVDAWAAPATVHPRAVYLHQGETFQVRQLDQQSAVALVQRGRPDHVTYAREVTDIRVLDVGRRLPMRRAVLQLGDVEVTNQVVGFLRRRLLSGEVLGEEPLDLPARRLVTRAVWWTAAPSLLVAAGLSARQVPGATHAAEHASIGLLPLVATCDRWDIGGVSTALHPDTGRATVFVYDGHPGGAGFAERGYTVAVDWLTATRDAVAGCRCDTGCPSCVQSPKCGNGNEPLDKVGAVRLLTALLEQWPAAG